MSIPKSITRDDCAEYLAQLLFPVGVETGNASPGTIGIELEQFTYGYDKDEKRPHQVAVHGKDSLSQILATHLKDREIDITYHDEPNAHDIKYMSFPDGNRILFEPGGQVEISTPPCDSAASLDRKIRSIQQMLASVTPEYGINFGQRGLNTILSSTTVSNQLNLPRYRALESYLNQIGPYGKQMMMQTCSLHINIDSGDNDETRMKRLVLANLLAPIATAIFANSAFEDISGTSYASFRSVIWRHTDPLRTGILPFHRSIPGMDKQAMIKTYLDFALDAPLIYIAELGDKVLSPDLTMRYWLDHPIEGLRPDFSHWANHLSLLFPEVRIKNYLEIRTVDAPPAQWQMVPVLFYAGILYSRNSSDHALALLLPYAERMGSLHAAAAFGLQDDIVFGLADLLMKLAIAGSSDPDLSWDLKGFIGMLRGFYEQFTVKRLTFADSDAK